MASNIRSKIVVIKRDNFRFLMTKNYGTDLLFTFRPVSSLLDTKLLSIQKQLYFPINELHINYPFIIVVYKTG